MKYRITRKEIKNNYTDIINIGYCAAQTLLINHSPLAYNCGTYGWNFDVYFINGTAICTGYRNLPGKMVNCKEEEKQAELIISNNLLTYDQKRNAIEKILIDFIGG